MPVTSEEWETELESVDQVAARDTDPAPPPTEPHNESPPISGAAIDAFFASKRPQPMMCGCCALPICHVCFRSCGQHEAKCTEAQ